MMLLARLEPLPQVFKAILDSFLLIVLISPALYLFLFRPLMREIQSRERAEAALKTANSMLEQRVAERTAELSASNERLAKTASELTQAEEQERQRIAAGLHDLVGEGLVTARLRLGMLKAELPDERSRLVEEVRDQLKKVIETTRVLTFQISNPLLYEVGLGAALEALLMRLAEDQPFQAEFEADAELERLSDGLKVILYRVVSELLVNIVKHARAETVRLTIRTPQGAAPDRRDRWRADDRIRPGPGHPGRGLHSSVETPRSVFLPSELSRRLIPFAASPHLGWPQVLSSTRPASAAVL